MLGDVDLQKRMDMLAATNLFDLFGETFSTKAFAFSTGLLTASQSELKVVQEAAFFTQLLFNAADLFALQFRTESDHERARLIPELALQAEGLDRF